MAHVRQCSRTACRGTAVSTLTYVYADSTVVLGPLATYAEPHSYDLCGEHAQRFTAPRNWDVLRLSPGETPPQRSKDDLLAIADAVREAGRPQPAPESSRPHSEPDSSTETGRRGHLRVLRDRGSAAPEI
ncbi:DUF3499 domain-containing protein [Saxibacter everestensis]|uniref:DUF3499 domain-containing protein n=1 Tax=Saxibacter everestensis TaxID=2909229 RepID=A0ABY8QR39_9MICO|nr:DUF3499 domain-containing protein [Brevibacteriaceae bacterium ZFBP1038]